MEKIIAGLVQMDSGPDMNENMRMAEQYVREAAEQGAKLILFPETAEYTGGVYCFIKVGNAPLSS